MNDQAPGKHDQVLLGLALNLQAVAMQQLGKLQDPASGEVRRDLAGAAGTIDILEMLKVKCRAGTPEDIVKLLDQAVMDLQLNYMEEMKRERAGDAGRDGDAGPDDGAGPDDAAAESDAAADADGEPACED